MASKGSALVVMAALLVICQTASASFQETLSAALSDAKTRGARSEVTFLTNLIEASKSVRAEHLSAVRQCKIGSLEGEFDRDKALATRLVGKFGNEAAKRVFPTLMGALSSATGSAIGVLLTDGGLTPDPFATIDAAYGRKTDFTREQLRDAARGTFRTDPKAFKTLDVTRKAAAFACLL